jgi:hypothetical protein
VFLVEKRGHLVLLLDDKSIVLPAAMYLLRGIPVGGWG